MKKLKFVTLVVLSTITLQAQNPFDNCFTRDFNANATGKNDKNTYLLSYLASATYADIITQFDEPNASIENLETIGAQLQLSEVLFMQKFRKVIAPLFYANPSTADITANIKYFDVDNRNFDGYDPEAIVINTDNTIYVSWRGTDRVQNLRNSLGYEIREWWQTDFQAIPFAPGPPFVGKVHQGAWLSMIKIANDVANKIEQFGGATKKVWITGHSLGGGQAQLFASYLNKIKNIKAQGVYTYAAPQFGDNIFNDDLENALGAASKIQRFEFIDDPITAAAQVIPAFKPAGIRNHYTALNNLNFSTIERTAGEITRIAATLPFTLFGFIPKTPVAGGICYHHQHWYVSAAFNQLSAVEKSRMPAPLSYKKIVNNFCGSLDVVRAENGQNIISTIVAKPVEVLVEAIDGTIDAANNFAHSISSLLSSFTANQLDPNYTGYYRIKNVYTNRYLCVRNDCLGDNECKFIQWSTTGQNGHFKIEKYSVLGLNFGYSIKLRGTTTVIDVDASNFTENIQLQAWTKNFIPTPNQAWGFYKIGNSNQFVIQSKVSGKVMDMSNSYFENGTPIRQRAYSANRQPQLWILEKVN